MELSRNGNNSLISVIVPVYNVEDYLTRCIESILDQTYTNFELLLVDDGSTDDSLMICKKYQDLDNRVMCFHKENGGLSDARNYGLEHMKGEYVTFIDSDDYIGSDYLRILFEMMEDGSSDVTIIGVEDFYKDSSAQCSEYSAMASNILSTFGYNVLYLGGSIKSDSGSGGHAYNIVILDGGYAIVDFSLPITKTTIEGKIIGSSPFIGFLEENSMDYISRFAINHEPIELVDYEMIYFGNSKLYINKGNNRYYVIGNVNYFDEYQYTK